MKTLKYRNFNIKSSLPRLLAIVIIFSTLSFWLRTHYYCLIFGSNNNQYCTSEFTNDNNLGYFDHKTPSGSGHHRRKHDKSSSNHLHLRNNNNNNPTLSANLELSTTVPLGLPCWSNYTYLRNILRFSESDSLTHTLLSQSALSSIIDTSTSTNAYSSIPYPHYNPDQLATICRYYPSGDTGGVQCCCEQRKYTSKDTIDKSMDDTNHNTILEKDPSGIFLVQSLTCLPRLIVVGEMKAGTSALFLTVVTGDSSVNQPSTGTTNSKNTHDRTLETASTSSSTTNNQPIDQQQLLQDRTTLLSKLMDDGRKNMPSELSNIPSNILSNLAPRPPPLIPHGANIPTKEMNNPLFSGSSLSRGMQGPPNGPPLPGWIPPPQGPGFVSNAVAFTAKLGPRAPPISNDRRNSFISLELDELTNKDLTFIGGSAKELNYFSIGGESAPVTNAYTTMQEIMDTISFPPSLSITNIVPDEMYLDASKQQLVQNPWHSHPTIHDMLAILYPCELTDLPSNADNNNKGHCPKDAYDDEYSTGFSISSQFRRRALHVRWRLIVDSSPAYLNYPLAIFRALRMLPYSHYAVLIRNPVDRAYSEYQMALRSGIRLSSADICFKETLSRLLDCSTMADTSPNINTTMQELHNLRNKWHQLWSSTMQSTKKWPNTVEITSPRAIFHDLNDNCWAKGGMDDIGRDALYRSLPLPHIQRINSIIQSQNKYSVFPYDDRLKIIWIQNLKDDSDGILKSIEVWLGMTKRHRISSKIQNNCRFHCKRDLEGLEALFSNKHMEEAMALGLNGGNSNRYEQLDTLIYQYWLDIFKPYDAALFDWLSTYPDLILHPTTIVTK